MSEFDKGLSPALVAAREHTRLVAKWGAFKVPGLDQHRAEAIGLKPLVKKIGYATPTQELPLNLRDPGNAARYIRRTAELLLQNCTVWKEIEINCRDTNAYYQEQLTTARVHEEAYRTAADILTKIVARPGLLKVWELSCPGLLQSKTRELEMRTAAGEEGTPVYLDTLKEKLRIDLVYDAVADLKKIEDERPIRASDIEVKQIAVAALAKEQQDKIMLQEAQLAQELKDIGDGSDTVLKFDGFLQACLPTNVLHLQSCQLLACPAEVMMCTHLEVRAAAADRPRPLPRGRDGPSGRRHAPHPATRHAAALLSPPTPRPHPALSAASTRLPRPRQILDLSHNEIPEIPEEVGNLLQLKKLYLDDNKLRTLPWTLSKLVNTLTSAPPQRRRPRRRPRPRPRRPVARSAPRRSHSTSACGPARGPTCHRARPRRAIHPFPTAARVLSRSAGLQPQPARGEPDADLPGRAARPDVPPQGPPQGAAQGAAARVEGPRRGAPRRGRWGACAHARDRARTDRLHWPQSRRRPLHDEVARLQGAGRRAAGAAAAAREEGDCVLVWKNLCLHVQSLFYRTRCVLHPIGYIRPHTQTTVILSDIGARRRVLFHSVGDCQPALGACAPPDSGKKSWCHMRSRAAASPTKATDTATDTDTDTDTDADADTDAYRCRRFCIGFLPLNKIRGHRTWQGGLHARLLSDDDELHRQHNNIRKQQHRGRRPKQHEAAQLALHLELELSGAFERERSLHTMAHNASGTGRTAAAGQPTQGLVYAALRGALGHLSDAAAQRCARGGPAAALRAHDAAFAVLERWAGGLQARRAQASAAAAGLPSLCPPVGDCADGAAFSRLPTRDRRAAHRAAPGGSDCAACAGAAGSVLGQARPRPLREHGHGEQARALGALRADALRPVSPVRPGHLRLHALWRWIRRRGDRQRAVPAVVVGQQREEPVHDHGELGLQLVAARAARVDVPARLRATAL